jgi:hypothetical protein
MVGDLNERNAFVPSTKTVRTGYETYEADGHFTIRGVSNPEKLTLTVSGKGTSAEIKGTMVFNRKDYGMLDLITKVPVVSSGEVNVKEESHLSNLPATAAGALTWKVIQHTAGSNLEDRGLRPPRQGKQSKGQEQRVRRRMAGTSTPVLVQCQTRNRGPVSGINPPERRRPKARAEDRPIRAKRASGINLVPDSHARTEGPERIEGDSNNMANAPETQETEGPKRRWVWAFRLI